MSKVAVQLLSYNGAPFLKGALDSLAQQTFQDFDLFVLDNGSTDGSVSIIETALAGFSRPKTFCKNTANSGFAGGHNQLFTMHGAPYVFCLNQDVVLEPDYLLKLVSFLDAHPLVGSVSGKMLRMGTDQQTIDSAGLAIARTRHVYDIDAGNIDHGQHDGVREVFGVSGAAPLYRRAAVLDVSPDGKLFDVLFFLYKEDVDLAWRMRLYGWQSFVVGGAAARHERSAKDGVKSAFAQRVSYRNHLVTLVKNETTRDFLHDLPWIITHEVGKFFYLLALRPRALAGLVDFFRLLPQTIKKRNVIQSQRKDSVRKWIV